MIKYEFSRVVRNASNRLCVEVKSSGEYKLHDANSLRRFVEENADITDKSFVAAAKKGLEEVTSIEAKIAAGTLSLSEIDYSWNNHPDKNKMALTGRRALRLLL